MNVLLAVCLCLLSVAQAFETPRFSSDPQLRLDEEKKDGFNIYRHDLNYFITGQPDTKIQFSFKIQFVHDWDLYFGYTQQMFWDLDKESSPFSDINYNPEIFYRWYLDGGLLKGLDAGFFEHRSNGRDGPESRSWDRSYVNIRLGFHLFGLESLLDTKLFHVYNLDKTNPDMARRLGYMESILTVKDLLSWLEEDELQLKIAPGGEMSLAHIQGYQELSYRFRLPIRRLNPFLYFQFYQGVSESLLHYDEHRTSYRVGLAI